MEWCAEGFKSEAVRQVVEQGYMLTNFALRWRRFPTDRLLTANQRTIIGYMQSFVALPIFIISNVSQYRYDVNK